MMSQRARCLSRGTHVYARPRMHKRRQGLKCDLLQHLKDGGDEQQYERQRGEMRSKRQ